MLLMVSSTFSVGLELVVFRMLYGTCIAAEVLWCSNTIKGELLGGVVWVMAGYGWFGVQFSMLFDCSRPSSLFSPKQ